MSLEEIVEFRPPKGLGLVVCHPRHDSGMWHTSTPTPFLVPSAQLTPPKSLRVNLGAKSSSPKNRIPGNNAAAYESFIHAVQVSA
jgi:hypothetical protein